VLVFQRFSKRGRRISNTCIWIPGSAKAAPERRLMMAYSVVSPSNTSSSATYLLICLYECHDACLPETRQLQSEH
jgi:hypothetical protein